MGRPASVLDDEVVEAGRALEAAGKAVNGWSLRRQLGDRGKPDRLEQVWREHVASGAAPEVDEPEPEVALPPSVLEHNRETKERLTASIDGLYVSVYRLIDGHLRAQYKSDFDRLAADRADMEVRLNEATDAIERADEARVDLEAQIERLRGEVGEANVAKARVEEQLRAALAENAALKAAAETAAVEHEAALETAEGERLAYAELAAEAKRAATAAEAARQAMAEELVRVRADRDAEVDRLRTEQREAAERHAAEIERLRGEQARALAERDAAADRARADHAAALEALRADHAEHAAALAASSTKASAEADRLRQELADAREAERAAVERERQASAQFAAELARLAAAKPAAAKGRKTEKEADDDAPAV